MNPIVKVFIPRPETEILIKSVLDFIFTSHEPRVTGHQLRILDIGTGSGNIPIALTKALPGATIVALDISEDAIEAARKNAIDAGVEKRIKFVRGDIFQDSVVAQFIGQKIGPINRATTTTAFDIIVSNPPYVPEWEWNTLSERVKIEPRRALVGGEDGLLFYRRIIALSRRILNADGLLAFEIGYNQAFAVEALLKENGYQHIRFIKDFNGVNRCVIAIPI